jgi:TPR repeat protein
MNFKKLKFTIFAILVGLGALDLSKGILFENMGIGSNQEYLSTFGVVLNKFKANQNGDISSMKRLRMYYGFWQHDIEERNYWLNKCAEAGDPECNYTLAILYIRSKNQPEKGLSIMEKAAKMGNADARKFLENNRECFYVQ